MKKLKHHFLLAFVAVALIFVSLPVMFDTFTQRMSVASELLNHPDRFSRNNLDTLSLIRPRPATPTIDLSHTGSVEKAKEALARIKSEDKIKSAKPTDIMAKAKRLADKTKKEDANPLSEVDKMLAEIDSVLNEIESISKKKHAPRITTDPTITASRSASPVAPTPVLNEERIQPTGSKTIDRINAEMAKAVEERAKKRQERITAKEADDPRAIAKKMLDRIDAENRRVATKNPQKRINVASAETIISSKSEKPEKAEVTNEDLAAKLFKFAEKHKVKATAQEAEFVADQLRKIKKDIADTAEKPAAATTTLAAAPPALREALGEDDTNFVEKINAGDVLQLNLPGETSLTGEFTVDRKGRIQLPEIGPVKISGSTIVEAGETVREKLSAAFKDLDRLSVEIKERKLAVSVLGFVKKPGQVFLNPEANIQQAISAADGLAVGAQLDRIQLRRGKKVVTFNYKEYLNSGDVTILPELRPLDIIFVPASPLTGAVEVPFSAETFAIQGDGGDDGKGIRIFGEVRTPTSIAHKSGVTLLDALMRAGGVTTRASVENIRVVTESGTEIINLKEVIDNNELANMPDLDPGATIYVPTKDKELQLGGSVVYIMGEAAKPGAYETRGETNFIDILANAGGPTRYAETRQIRIIRKDNKTIEWVDLPAFTEGKVNSLPTLFPGDTIFIPEKADTSQPSWLKIPSTRAVQVLGAMKSPGRYEWDDSMSFFDLIATAGGPTKDADMSKIKILEKGDDGKVTSRFFNMSEFVKNGGTTDDLPKIRAGYVVVVPSTEEETANSTTTIKVLGEVKQPGNVEYSEGRTVVDIILDAGGLTPNAAVDRIRVLTAGEPVFLNLQDYLDSGDASILPTIEPGSTIFVPRAIEGQATKSVQSVYILGEVAKPSGYEIQEEASIIEVLTYAGGPTRFADTNRIRIIRVNGKTEETDLVAFTRGKSTEVPTVYPGDTIFVPRLATDPNRPSWTKITPDNAVEVFGAVARAGRYEWTDEMGLFDLIAEAGGPNDKADMRRIQVVTRKDGEVTRVIFDMKKFIEEKGNESDVPKVTAGSTVVIPYLTEDPNRPSWLKVKPNRAIEVLGAVNKPDRYEWSPEMTFFDLLGRAGGPTENADVERIQISRRINGSVETTIFNMKEFLRKGGLERDIPVIDSGTIITVPTSTENPNRQSWIKIAPNRAVEIIGAVNRPDRYEWSSEMTFFDLLGRAGGPNDKADVERIEIIRRVKGTAHTVIFNMREFVKNGGKNTKVPFIDAGTTINVPFLSEDVLRPSWIKIDPDRAVEVIGAVNKPDRYEWSDKMTFFDLIAHAGGPNRRADISNVQILVKENGRTIPTYFNMQKFIQEGGSNEEIPKIRAGYVINIPFLPDDPTDNKSKWIKQAAEDSIYVFGQVGAPGRYAFSEDLSFIDIISAADGPTATADLRNIRVSHRKRGEAGVSKVNLSLYFQTGDEDLLPHVVPGDVIYVPSREREWLDIAKEQTVRVIGAVGTPGRYRFEDNMTILDLLAEAGGPTANALQRKIVVVNLSKSRDQARTFNLVRFAKTGDTSRLPIVRAGDMVYVPDKSQTAWKKLQNGIAGTSSLMTFLFTIAAL